MNRAIMLFMAALLCIGSLPFFVSKGEKTRQHHASGTYRWKDICWQWVPENK